MEINRLYRVAEKSGILVDRYPLSENRSASVKYGDKLFVARDNAISGAEEKVCLAHELGHCETMSFYYIYSRLMFAESTKDMPIVG